MAKGKKTGGRLKGTPNKITSTVKDNVLACFERIGGLDTMETWANENQTEFFRMYSKLIPVETKVEGEIIIIQKKYSIGSKNA